MKSLLSFDLAGSAMCLKARRLKRKGRWQFSLCGVTGGSRVGQYELQITELGLEAALGASHLRRVLRHSRCRHSLGKTINVTTKKCSQLYAPV